RNAESKIIILGGVLTNREDPRVSFGASQYAKTILGVLWGAPAWVDLGYEERVQACCRRLIGDGIAASAHDVSDGGLAVALAECCMAADMGAAVELSFNDNARLLLFAEDPSRILITVAEKHLLRVDRIVSRYNMRAAVLGTTGGPHLSVSRK